MQENLILTSLFTCYAYRYHISKDSCNLSIILANFETVTGSSIRTKFIGRLLLSLPGNTATSEKGHTTAIFLSFQIQAVIYSDASTSFNLAALWEICWTVSPISFLKFDASYTCLNWNFSFTCFQTPRLKNPSYKWIKKLMLILQVLLTNSITQTGLVYLLYRYAIIIKISILIIKLIILWSKYFFLLFPKESELRIITIDWEPCYNY